METLHFGIYIAKNDIFNAQEVAARLFLCPRISTEHVSRMIEMMIGGTLALDSFMSKTDSYIEELSHQKEVEGDISSIMNSKFEAWCKVFKAPSAKDYKYLEKTFGFSKKDLFGEMTDDKERVSSPKDLYNLIRQYIKGQDEAIAKLSVPMFLHLQSVRRKETCRLKTPAVLMGPTGSGKSELLRRCGSFCGCPVIRVNLSSVVPEGWRGTHITDIIAHEIRAGVSIKELEYAIIVFHEFDKITHYGSTRTSEAGNDGDLDMMRDIMRLFETDYSLLIDTGIDQTTLKPATYKLPVDNLMIVFDGAFHGIERIIAKRLNIGKSIGFGQCSNNRYEGVNLQTLVTTDDLNEWGYLPELIGRIGEIVVMNPLSADTIYEIMTSAKESILQLHIEYCSRNNINLHFEESALRYIAEEAHKSGLGFRNVKTLLAKALNRLYFNMTEPKSKKKTIVEISEDFLMKNLCLTDLFK